jgi:hypothetical protein
MNFHRIGPILLICLCSACGRELAGDRIYLFNGEDLAGWDTYLGRPQQVLEVPGLERNEDGYYMEVLGLNNDPLRIFSVVEDEGEHVIRISGYVWGGLITKQEYENYHLHLEYKWGELKHPPREDLPRNSGLCYHSVGDFGVFWTFWMRSCELEIMEGGLGDFVRVDEVYADIKAEYIDKADSPGYRYSPLGDTTEVNYLIYKVFASNNNEYLHDKWNNIDLFIYDQEAIHMVNGQVVLKAANISESLNEEKIPLTKGKIQLQSEGAEIFYRNIYIEPIDQLPETE